MAQPLRKIFQKNLLSGAEAPQNWRERAGRAENAVRQESAGRGRSAENTRRQPREARGGAGRRRTLDLSAAATVGLGLALVAAVGWAFFMGYLVGRGEHPERGVESVAGLLRPRAETAAEAPPHAPLPGEEALPAQGGLAGAAAASVAAPENPAPANAPATAAGAGQAPGAAPEAGAPSAPAAPPAAPAYPFSRPQGAGLAAWGISEGGEAPAPPQTLAQARAQQQARTGQRPQPQATAAPAKPAEPRFDYVFQAAAFKGPVDAERLRARLEGAGLRTRVRQSGKVRLVLVSVRGSARDAEKVRGQLAAMGLGRPLQLEKKPVTETTGGKGRRRSAP